MLVFAAFGFLLTVDSYNDSSPSNYYMLACFLFAAPIAVLYTFFSWRKIANRKLAIAAFVGAIVLIPIIIYFVIGLVVLLRALIKH